MEKVWLATKKGRKEYRRASLSSEEMKVIENLMGNKSATSSQLEVAGCEMWLLRSMRRSGLIKEQEG